jgi:hypothetical protein
MGRHRFSGGGEPTQAALCLFDSEVCGRVTGDVGKRRRPAVLLPSLELGDEG